MFNAETYAERRRALMEAVPSGVLLFLGNTESPMNYVANPYRFRQDSSFLYCWGLDQPALAATLDADSGESTLYGHDPTMDEIVWMGPKPSLRERAERIGVEVTGCLSDAEEAVRTAIRDGRTVHILPPYRDAQRHTLQEWLGIQAGRLDDYVSEPFIRAVVDQRAVKSDAEVEQIEQAVRVTKQMHVRAMHMAAPGVVEREIAGTLEGMALAHGGELSFPMICSVRGEVLHNHDRRNRMEDGDLLLVDTGATSPMHYAGDITRVTPVSGQFTERQRDIYQIVLDAQVEAIEAVAPGVAFKDIHLQAARHMTDKMKALGFMKGDVDEAVEVGAHAIFFQTGLGHMMGLDVHDMEALGEDYVGYDADTTRSQQFGLSYLRFARALEPGFVVTVEPGIYFIPQLIEQWEAERRHAAFINYDAFKDYIGFGGIRIEDDVLVTGDGHRVLGPAIPKTVEDVEAEARATATSPASS